MPILALYRNLYVDPCLPNSCCHKECLDIAFLILVKMDQNVDPCNDFYRFACGNFLRKVSFPQNGPSLKKKGSFTDIVSTVYLQIKSILEDEIQSNDLRVLKNIKNYYKICTNEVLVEKQGLEPLHNILKEFGGWPVLNTDKRIGSDVSWMDSVYKSHKLGYPSSSFITLKIVVDPKNSTHRVLQLDQASLGLAKEHLSKGEDDITVREYLSFMVDIAEMLGAHKDRARIEMQESLRFEISLANISRGEERGRNATALYKMMTVRELIREFPSFPWLDYINKLLAPNVIIAEDEPVMVNVPSYIAGLEKLLKKTSNRTLANYAIWRVVKTSIVHLNSQIRKREEAYLSVIPGAVHRMTKWVECVSLVLRYFGFAVGSLYERLHFNKKLKERLGEVTSNIQRELENVFLTVNWMDEDTKEAALKKARSMSQHIGYPDDSVQDLEIEEYYRNFTVDPKSSILHASLSVSRTIRNRNVGKLREPVGANEWIYKVNPVDVFAAYFPNFNSIVLTASIFQEEYLKPGVPNYVDYGTIGMIVGHEMMHAFDDLGSQYDEKGNIKEWWTDNTRTEFGKRVQCLINQANNYTPIEGSIK
ncbi:hypothetical protein QAD02_001306, partial [Eretmocerus hayati]